MLRKTDPQFEAECDCCKAVEPMKSLSRPAHWIDLHILRDAYDFQGHACADASVKLLLCTKCADAAVKAVNQAFDEVRALLAKDNGHV